MKKLIFGLIATVIFGLTGNAQSKTDFFGKIEDMSLTNVTSDLARRPIKIIISWEAGRWCFQDDPGCRGSLELRTAPNQNGKIDLVWTNLGTTNFVMPNAKLFGPETSGSSYYVYIPMQTLKYNNVTKSFEAQVEFYTR